MTTITERIAAHVAAHPGVRYAELCAAVGISTRCGLVAYARRTGRIFSAGLRHWQRYYPSADEASAADAQVRKEAVQHLHDSRVRGDAERNRRRKAASKVLGRSRNTRPTQAVQGAPSATSFVVDGKRFLIQPERARDPDAPPRVVNPAECRPWANVAARAMERAPW